MFAYARRVIRVRGVPISDEEANELARLLAGDEAGLGLADRINRALAMGGGLVGTDRLEARATLVAVDALLDRGPCRRLLELRASLVSAHES
jgi:hypothetical protein